MERPDLDSFVLSPIQRKRRKNLDTSSILNNILEQLAGEDGDDGEDGVSIISALVNEEGNLVLTFTDGKTLDVGHVRGEDGDDADEVDIADVVERVLSLIPEMEAPEVDVEGIVDAVTSKIPQKATEEIVSEIVERGLKLPISVIEDLEALIESKKNEIVSDTDRKVKAIRMTGGNTNIRIKGAGVPKGQVETLNFIGATVTPIGDGREANVSITAGTGTVNTIVAGTNITVDATDPANPIVSSTGGGSFSVMVPTGTVDGSNKTFVFSVAPNIIVVDDGSTMNKTRKDGQANWSGTTTVVMTVAPTGNIFGY